MQSQPSFVGSNRYVAVGLFYRTRPWRPRPRTPATAALQDSPTSTGLLVHGRADRAEGSRPCRRFRGARRRRSRLWRFLIHDRPLQRTWTDCTSMMATWHVAGLSGSCRPRAKMVAEPTLRRPRPRDASSCSMSLTLYLDVISMFVSSLVCCNYCGLLSTPKLSWLDCRHIAWTSEVHGAHDPSRHVQSL